MTSRTRRTLSVAAVVLVAIAAAGYVATRRGAAAFLRAGNGSDSVALASTALEQCRGKTGDAQMECYDAFLVPLVASHGVRVAMGTLHVLGTHDAQLRADGHVYAHAIGIAAGKAGTDIGATFASCTEIFQSGCYHGVIQAYFEHVHAVDTAAVNDLCRSYTNQAADQWLRFQCVHGMGHGLTMFYGHDLPQALTGCDLLRDGWDRESCYGGAFMENIVNATAPHHASHELHMHGAPPGHAAPFKALDANDLQYPCSMMAQRYLVACYNMQTSVMLHFTNGDMAAAAKGCLDAPPSLRPVCFQSLGRDISAYSRQDHHEAIRMCSFASAEFQPWCHVGVVKNFIDLTARVADGVAYCRSVTGAANRTRCYEAVGEQVATLRNGRAKREAECAAVADPYRDWCRYGARIIAERPRPAL